MDSGGSTPSGRTSAGARDVSLDLPVGGFAERARESVATGTRRGGPVRTGTAGTALAAPFPAFAGGAAFVAAFDAGFATGFGAGLAAFAGIAGFAAFAGFAFTGFAFTGAFFFAGFAAFAAGLRAGAFFATDGRFGFEAGFAFA
jgi:hypothetical protein